MGGTILIAVKRHNQIEEIIPVLKNSMKAGTRVVFLVRYHISSLQLCCLSGVEALQPGASAALAARYSWLGAQPQSAEYRILASCEALSRQGIGVTVHPYTGRLRKAIRKYAAREDVQLIMTAKEVVPKTVRFVNRLLHLIRCSKRHTPPALLFRSNVPT
jgi:hypothetical protein